MRAGKARPGHWVGEACHRRSSACGPQPGKGSRRDSPRSCTTSTTSRSRNSYCAIKRDAAPGVDGVTWKGYAADLEANLAELLDERALLRHRAHAGRRAGAGELLAAVPGPHVRAAQRVRPACRRAVGLGGVAGVYPECAAPLRARGDRARAQGDRHPGGAAPGGDPPRHSPQHRDRRGRWPDHAGRHGARRAVDGGHAQGHRRVGRPAGAGGIWRSPYPSCCWGS